MAQANQLLGDVAFSDYILDVTTRQTQPIWNPPSGVPNLVCPTELHDVHPRLFGDASRTWIFDGLMDQTESRLLDMNLAFDNFSGVYQGSVKQPDHFLRVDTDPEP